MFASGKLGERLKRLAGVTRGEGLLVDAIRKSWGQCRGSLPSEDRCR